MAGTIVANTLNTDTGVFSTNNAYLGVAKAWVNFSVSGSSCTVVSSFNVSSVTYTSTGQYAVNMATSMPNANYVPLVGAVNTFGSGVYYGSGVVGTPSASAFSMRFVGGNGTYTDLSNGYAAVFSN
jgi:hypothetical protein